MSAWRFLFYVLSPHHSISSMKVYITVGFFLALVMGQSRIGDWDSFTSTLEIKSMINVNGKVFCSTRGGLLIFDPVEKKFTSVTNIDGLMGSNLAALALDPQGNLWIGGGEPHGFVQFYDPLRLESIAEFKYDLTEIQHFAVVDSQGYALYKLNQDLGLIEFQKKAGRYIHKDLYPNWPGDAANVSGIYLFDNKVYVATDKGLIVGDSDSDPHTWTRPFEELNGNITSVYLSENRLYSVVNKRVFSLDLINSEIVLIAESFSNPLLGLTITADGNSLWGYDSENIYKFNDQEIEFRIPVTKNHIRSLIGMDKGDIIFGTETGLMIVDDSSGKLESIKPNTLHSGQITAVTVLNDGRIVAGTKDGIAIKETGGWRNIVATGSEIIVHEDPDFNYFVADTLPLDFGESISDLEQGPDGYLYCAVNGTYPPPRRNGGGIVILDVDDPANFTVIDTTYLDYFSNEFMIIYDLEWDRFQNLWVANPFATVRKEPIQVLTSQSDWGSFSADVTPQKLSLTPNSLAVDAWGRVWVASFVDNAINIGYPNGGLAVLIYDGDPASPSDILWKEFPRYNASSVWSVDITDNNRLYVLSPSGLDYFDLQFSRDDPIAASSPRTYFPNIPFDGSSKVVSDTRGNAWVISPTEGVHVLLSNATFWPNNNPGIDVESFNSETTPLLSNIVSDIAFDTNLGLAYISSNLGINSVRIPFAEKKTSYSQLKIYPSPYVIPNHYPLIMEGLRDNSSVQILTLTGEVVRHLKTSDMGIHGDQVGWDGKNKSGDWVPSGVYLISIYDPDGSSTFGKITVIRQ